MHHLPVAGLNPYINHVALLIPGGNLKNTVEICANCGKISKEQKEDFLCSDCGSHVSVVVPVAMFRQMVKQGLARE
jgi:DNA-directed RNA polymerase subunit RPC12/RpoP